MAAPDCSTCEAAGLRSCDVCGAVIAPPFDSPFGGELCDECRGEKVLRRP